MKGRLIQDNLHLIREVLEEIEDGTEPALINIDQSKAFDRVNHRFLASVLETAGFKLEFRKWISLMYHKPQAVVQVNGWHSKAFANERSVRQGCPLSPLLYDLALEPLLRRLRDVGENPALHGVPLAGPLTPRVYAFADDITVFVSCHLDIKAVKKAVSEYKQITGAIVNFDKSDCLRLGAWRGSDTLPGPDLQLERNSLEVQAKVEAKVGTWLPRRLSLKGRVEVCTVYVFPLIHYPLAILPLPGARPMALQRSLTRLLWGCRRLMVSRQVCIQRTRNGVLGMPGLVSHWLAERLAYLGILVGLHGTRCPFSAWTSEQAWQTCPIVLAIAVVWKKRLSTPSTTASEFVRSGITSGSGWLASNQSSSCCSTLVTSLTTFCLRFRREACGVSRDPSCSSNGDLDDVEEGIVWRCKLFSPWSDIVFRYQLRVKIRCDRKRLDRKTFELEIEIFLTIKPYLHLNSVLMLNWMIWNGTVLTLNWFV